MTLVWISPVLLVESPHLEHLLRGVAAQERVPSRVAVSDLHQLLEGTRDRMLTQENDVDVHALARQGWTVSAIARHLGHDRKTIRAYLSGGRVAGQRAPAASAADPLEAFVDYLRQRLADDPHVWAVVLFDEAVRLGFDRSYPTFTKGLRRHRLRPHCEPCSASTGRDHTVIEHPPGEEVQWDWVELPDPPASWGPGRMRTCWSGRWRPRVAGGRCWQSPSSTPTWSRACTRCWSARRAAEGLAVRPDGDGRQPDTGRITATFAAVAKHYAVRWRSARRGTATARAWWRRRTTAPRSAGGAPWPTTSPSSRPRRRWTRSAPGSAMPGCAAATGSADLGRRAGRRRATAARCRQRSRPLPRSTGR